jgi:transposase-like protein
MTLKEFTEKYHDEDACMLHFRKLRVKQGVYCRLCKENTEQHWMEGTKRFRCKKCNTQTTLRSGTVLQGSNLSYKIWYTAFFLMSFTKNPFTAKEVQRQLGYKRYGTIWFLMHKIRRVMGINEAKLILKNRVEMDETFVFSHNADQSKVSKQGRGTSKAKVVVMAESVTYRNNYGVLKERAGSLRMVVVDKIDSKTLTETAKKQIDQKAEVKTDGLSCYNQRFKKIFTNHNPEVIPPHLAHICMPWVHYCSANLKKQLDGIFYYVDQKYLQNYLDEFTFKFNLRYQPAQVLPKLLNLAVLTSLL